MFFKPNEINFDKLFQQNLDIKLCREKTNLEWNNHIENMIKSRSLTYDLEKYEIIENKDIVKLDISSNIERFNKKDITVTLGLGIYCLDFENKLTGLKIGDCKDISFKYKGDDVEAKVHIISAKRNNTPKLNDEFIKENCKEGDIVAETLDEYKRKWCSSCFIANLQDEFISKLYMKCVNELLIKSDIAIEQKYLDEAEEAYAIWEKEELPRYSSKVEYYKSTFGNGVDSEHDGIEKVKKHIKAKAGLKAYVNELAKHDNLKISYETYEKEIDSYSREQGIDKKELIDNITFDDYKESLKVENLSKQLLKLLDKYIRDRGVVYEE